MVIKQYPHTIIINGFTDDATYQDGVYTIPAAGPDVQQICRYEPSTLNRELPLADGTSVKYKGIVYLPIDSPDIDNGVLIEIVGVIKAKTLYFIRNEMNCTLYV